MKTTGLGVPESRTNFALMRFASADAANAADQALRAEGIMMRAMGGYGLADCLRATIGREEDMQLAHDILATWSNGEITR